MIAIYVQPSGIHAFRLLRQLEVYIYIIFGYDTCSVFCPFKSLFDRHSTDKVQVDVFRDIQYRLLDEIGRIERHEQMPRKAKAFGNKRNKPQVHTLLSVDLQRIEQIILIEIRPHAGQRAYKTLQEERNIILKNIYFTKNFSQELLHAIT